MKRVVTALVAILSLATAGIAYAEDPGTVQPPCADFTGSGGFSLNGSLVSGSLDLADTSCTTITYTLNVSYTNQSGRVFTKSDSVQGNGTSSIVSFSIRVPGNLASVETFVSSTDASGNVLDRGPDTGTITVTSGSGGGTGYN